MHKGWPSRFSRMNSLCKYQDFPWCLAYSLFPQQSLSWGALWIPRFSFTVILPYLLLIAPTMRLSWLWEKECSNSSSVKERQLDKWYQHWVKAYCHHSGHQSRTMTCNLKISFEMRNLDTLGAKFNQLSLSLWLIQLPYFYLPRSKIIKFYECWSNLQV